MKKNKYLCPVCGKKHTFYPGLEVPPPAAVTDLSREEREERIREFGYMQVLDLARPFVNGYVYLYEEGNDEPVFSWHLWAEVDFRQFISQLTHLREDKPPSVQVRGTMPPLTIFYGPGEPLEVEITLFYDDIDPIVHVITDSQIKQDQERPISRDRAIEIMNRLHHPPARNAEPADKRPFAVRLKEVLEKVRIEYCAHGKHFAINFQGSTVVSLQIVNGPLLNQHAPVEHLGLHFPFDDMEEEARRFNQQTDFAEYDHHVWDGIDTYQLNFGLRDGDLINATIDLLRDVLEEDVDDVRIEPFEV